MKYKKQRGQKRRLRALLRNIDRFSPFADTDVRYEHFSVPSGPFISSPKTSGKIKTAFCKAWLAKTAQIIAQKPADLSFCRVVALLHEPDFWQSQIIVVYDRSYYDSFWIRDGEVQRWIPIDGGRSPVKERHIETDLPEKGYLEILTDGDSVRKSALWFYGEV